MYKFTFPLDETVQRTENNGFLRVLEDPFEKASLFFNGVEFKPFREVGFAGKLKETRS